MARKIKFTFISSINQQIIFLFIFKQVASCRTTFIILYDVNIDNAGDINRSFSDHRWSTIFLAL